MLDRSPRRPRKGDRLIRPTKDWNRGVDFPQSKFSRDALIEGGYMRAGSALIEACEEDPDRHLLIYPILFNYRHGIELAMKWMIRHYGPFSSVGIANTTDHNLRDLWRMCKHIIIELGSEDEEDETIGVVEKVIEELHELDESAQAFRYSHDKTGAVFALPDGMIDLRNIRDVMEGIRHFFDGADAQLDAHCTG